MATTKTLIKAVAPELAALDTESYSDTWSFCISEANSLACSSQTAQTYYAAHLLSISLPVGSSGTDASVAGPVKRKKSRSLEIEYDNSSSKSAASHNASLMSTKYGQLYLSTVRRKKTISVLSF